MSADASESILRKMRILKLKIQWALLICKMTEGVSVDVGIVIVRYFNMYEISVVRLLTLHREDERPVLSYKKTIFKEFVSLLYA